MSEDEWMDKSFGELPTMQPEKGSRPRETYSTLDSELDGILDGGSTDGGRRLKKGETILARYEVEGELGQGGMGVVYLCLDRVGGVRVAVKALPPDVAHDSAEMEEVRDNFQLVVGLRHSCIAGVRTLERDARGEYYLIMDVAEGESMRKWIRAKWKSGGLRLADAVGVLRQVASALDYAHSQKVVHRDVKPGNVMIDAEGRAKVLDFGLAAQIRTSLSRTSRLVRGTSGTGPYMSPEQWEAQPQDARADQYALGVMAYEMLAGRLPFENPDISVLREAVLKGAIRDIPGLPPKAMAAIRRAMAKEPSDRFPSCGAFVDALSGKRQAAGKPVSAKALSAGAGALAAVLALAVGVGVWMARPKDGAAPPAPAMVHGLPGPAGTDNTAPSESGDPTELALEAFRANDFERGFRLAMANGQAHPKLQFYLGMCHDEQEKAAKVARAGKSDWTAKVWYGKSAGQGDVRAMMKLSLFAEEGRAGEKDLQAAMEWSRRAADAGSTAAKGNLERLKSMMALEAEDQRMEELRLLGYTIVGGPGKRQAVWREGARSEKYPHWITGKAEKTWRTEDGYAKVNPTGMALSEVRWKPGLPKAGDPDTKAGPLEGTWLKKAACPACGKKGQVASSEICSVCGGTGRTMADKSCTRCGGTGQQTEKSLCRDCNGRKTAAHRCPDCNGNGTVACGNCRGTGREANPLAAAAEIANLFSDKKINMGSEYVTCSACRGQRTKACARCGGGGSIHSRCETCRGTGERSWTMDCPNCHGSGKTVASEACHACNDGRQQKWHRCPQCNGDGFVWE